MNYIKILLLVVIFNVNMQNLSAEQVAKEYDKNIYAQKAISAPFIAYGNPDASIYIDEYASMTCAHCKSFYETTFQDLKKNYIDTGKVYFRFFYFPFDLNAFNASKLIECTTNNATKQKLKSVLFKNHSEWAYLSQGDTINKLKNIGIIAGINGQDFDNCINDKTFGDKILEHQLYASKEVGINSTPSIIINNEIYNGSKIYKHLSAYLDQL